MEKLKYKKLTLNSRRNYNGRMKFDKANQVEIGNNQFTVQITSDLTRYAQK